MSSQASGQPAGGVGVAAGQQQLGILGEQPLAGFADNFGGLHG